MGEEDTTSTIDFSKFSQPDLEGALGRINRDRFPANYEACLSEIQKRKTDGRWTEAVVSGAAFEKSLNPFSVRRRYFSYFIDAILVSLFSLAFLPLSSFLNQIGLIGVLPFWFLNFAYGTLLVGPTGKGQTFGKKILNLRVIAKNGSVLSWSQASLRGAYLVLLVGIRFGLFGFFPESIFQKLLEFLLVNFLALDLLFIFKHPQKRSLMDLLSDTLVHDVRVPAPPDFIGASAVSGFKGWVVGVIFIVSTFFGYGLFFPPSPMNLQSESYRADIEAQTHLRYAGIQTFKHYRNEQSPVVGTTFLFWLSPEYLSNPSVVAEQSKKAREILASKIPASAQTGYSNVVITGHIYKGLLPVAQTYRNFDQIKAPAN